MNKETTPSCKHESESVHVSLHMCLFIEGLLLTPTKHKHSLLFKYLISHIEGQGQGGKELILRAKDTLNSRQSGPAIDTQCIQGEPARLRPRLS